MEFQPQELIDHHPPSEEYDRATHRWDEAQRAIASLMEAYVDLCLKPIYSVVEYYQRFSAEQEEKIDQLREEIDALGEKCSDLADKIEANEQPARSNGVAPTGDIQQALHNTIQSVAQYVAMEPEDVDELIWNDVMRAHETVWVWRARLSDKWPTPSRSICKAFAMTEAGEAIDAWTRTMSEFSRNRAAEKDEDDEWADCAMMILSAYSFNRSVPTLTVDPPDDRIELAAIVARFAAAEDGSNMEQTLAADALYSLSKRMNFQMARKVEQRLHRIAERVGYAKPQQ